MQVLSRAIRVLFCFTIVFSSASYAVWANPPPEINIQGNLEAAGGGPLTGVRDFRVRFFDSGTGDAAIGEVSETVTLSSSGRFSIDVIPPSAALGADETWYELAIDAAADGIGLDDIFPDRVRILSVPFALRSQDAETLGGRAAANYVTNASIESVAWTLTGNSDTSPGAHFIGTSDNSSLRFRVNNSRALEIIPNATSPNIIAGYSGNVMTPEVSGGTISGGGAAGEVNSITSNSGTVGGGNSNSTTAEFGTVSGGRHNQALAPYAAIAGGGANSATDGNRVTDKYGFVGGGFANQAGDDEGTVTDAWLSAVAGGSTNMAGGAWSFVGGGLVNRATASESTIAGGNRNSAIGLGAFVGGAMATRPLVSAPSRRVDMKTPPTEIIASRRDDGPRRCTMGLLYGPIRPAPTSHPPSITNSPCERTVASDFKRPNFP